MLLMTKHLPIKRELNCLEEDLIGICNSDGRVNSFKTPVRGKSVI